MCFYCLCQFALIAYVAIHVGCIIGLCILFSTLRANKKMKVCVTHLVNKSDSDFDKIPNNTTG